MRSSSRAGRAKTAARSSVYVRRGSNSESSHSLTTIHVPTLRSLVWAIVHAKKAEARLFGDLEAINVRFQETPPLPMRPLVRMSREKRGETTARSDSSSPSVLAAARCLGLLLRSARRGHGQARSHRESTRRCRLLMSRLRSLPSPERYGSPVGCPLGTTPVEGLVYVLMLNNQLLFTFVTFLFLYITYAEYSRRAAQLRLLGQMLTHGAGSGLRGFRTSLDIPANGCAFLMVMRLLHETGRVFILRMAAFANWYMALFAARCVFIIFSFVLPLLYGDEIDTAGVTTTVIEVVTTIILFTLITSSVGACNAEHHRIEEILLLARLELSTRVVAEPTLEAAAETIDRMLAVLAHMRTHSPSEFCGLQSAGEFIRLIIGVLAGCGGLIAALLISTSTSPVVSVVQAPSGNWTTSA